MPESDGQYETVIGPDASFHGELEFEKGVRVLGRFEGKITSKGNLHVAEGGIMKADVQAGNVQIEGEIKGNLAATGKVLLKATARLEGDLRTARLEVAEGAVFVGNCVVGPQTPSTAGTGASGKGGSRNNESAKAKPVDPQPVRK